MIRALSASSAPFDGQVPGFSRTPSNPLPKGSDAINARLSQHTNQGKLFSSMKLENRCWMDFKWEVLHHSLIYFTSLFINYS